MEERDFLRLIYMQMNTRIEIIGMCNYCNGFCMIVRLFEIIFISQTLSISLASPSMALSNQLFRLCISGRIHCPRDVYFKYLPSILATDLVYEKTIQKY